MTKLSVNVNKVATLRNTRHLGIPSVLRMSELCLAAGAHGITIHPRPDERHIRASALGELAKMMDRWPGREFNIEGNPFEGAYVQQIEAVRPTQCTLVPDDVNAFTSNQGWKIAPNRQRLREVIARLKPMGSRVSLFMDADSNEVEDAAAIGADRIELYTEPYAEAFARGDPASASIFADCARRATAAGLGVNAGHDLSLANLGHFLREVPGVLEVSIGHALIGDALEFGMSATVKKYLALCQQQS